MAALFLLSDQGASVNGQAIAAADGGPTQPHLVDAPASLADIANSRTTPRQAWI